MKTTNFDAVFASSPQNRTAAVVTGGRHAIADHRLDDMKRAMRALDEQLRQARLTGAPRAALAERKIQIMEELTELRRSLGIATKSEIKRQNLAAAPTFDSAFVEEAKARLPKYLFDELVALTKRRLADQTPPLAKP